MGPRDADAIAEGDAILTSPFTAEEKMNKRKVKVGGGNTRKSKLTPATTILSIQGEFLQEESAVDRNLRNPTEPTMIQRVEQEVRGLSRDNKSDGTFTIMDHFYGCHSEVHALCVLCNQKNGAVIGTMTMQDVDALCSLSSARADMIRIWVSHTFVDWTT